MFKRHKSNSIAKKKLFSNNLDYDSNILKFSQKVNFLNSIEYLRTV